MLLLFRLITNSVSHIVSRTQGTKGTAMLHRSNAAEKQDSVSPLATWLTARPQLTELGLPALTALFGMQALRVLMPGSLWVLTDSMSWGAIQVGTVVILVFLFAFLAGGLQQLLGSRLALIVTAGGLGLLRLSMQVWSSEPVVNLSLAMAGTTLFGLFLPTYLRHVGLRAGAGAGRFAVGLLVGLILDTALHGVFDTYDINWQAGLLPVLLTLVLVLVQWILLAGIALAGNEDVTRKPGAAADRGPIVKSFPLLAVGPFLFLQLVVFQNVARAAVLTGWSLPIAFGWTLLAQLAGLAAGSWLLSSARRTLWPLALVAGLGLVAILASPEPEAAALTAPLFLVGQVLLSLLIVLVFSGIGVGVSVKKMGFSSTNVAFPLGMILLLLFLVGYYLVYHVSLPYDNAILEPVAAFVVASCAVGASTALRPPTGAGHRPWLVTVLALPLLILPLTGALTWRAPAAVSGEGFPVRVMTYNLHNGFNTEGYLGMEDIARVIEDSRPDIVALQEVSRGWVISGRVDMLEWLSQRLQMPYVFGPTADAFWGNAILSRYPILEYAEYDLPPRDLPLLRGLVLALIDLGNGDRLQVIATHYHHVEEDSDVRQLQARETVEIWNGDGQTVLLGDLNATLGAPEMDMLQNAGLVDALAGIEPPPAYTWPSVNPYRRIDYIWVSPDLKVNDIRVIASNASDHLAVVAEIDH